MIPKFTKQDVTSSFPDHKDYGQEIAIRQCPACKREKYKFYANYIKGVTYCQHCHYCPPLSVLIGQSRYGLYDPVKKVEEEPEKLPPLIDFQDMDMMHSAFMFLHDRGYTPMQLQNYGAAYCQQGKHRGRIIFPFYGCNGEYLGFQGRYIQESKKIPGWRTGSRTKKGEILWNFEKVLNNHEEWCILVEGIFDALRLKDHAVAMLGKKPSRYQRELLEHFRYIFIMLDPDATEEAKKLSRKLVNSSFYRVAAIPLEKGDPDEHEFEELVEILLGNIPPRLGVSKIH